jgi:hypothetical protein
MKSTRGMSTFHSRSQAGYNSVFGHHSRSIDNREFKKLQREKFEKVKLKKE